MVEWKEMTYSKEEIKILGILNDYLVAYCSQCKNHTLHIRRGFEGYNRRIECVICSNHLNCYTTDYTQRE
jgi:hypothetical protein